MDHFRDRFPDRAGPEHHPGLPRPAGGPDGRQGDHSHFAGREKKPRIDPLDSGLASLLLGIAFWKAEVSLPAAGLALGIFWLWLCVPLFTKKTLIQGLRAEMLVDFSFILAGAAGLALARF